MDSNKVIIMEVKDDYAIVMTSDFEFIKIKITVHCQFACGAH